jgi:hypothetical protein
VHNCLLPYAFTLRESPSYLSSCSSHHHITAATHSCYHYIDTYRITYIGCMWRACCSALFCTFFHTFEAARCSFKAPVEYNAQTHTHLTIICCKCTVPHCFHSCCSKSTQRDCVPTVGPGPLAALKATHTFTSSASQLLQQHTTGSIDPPRARVLV